jgi:hypothetical protein
VRCLASSFESSVGKLILVLLANSQVNSLSSCRRLVNPFYEPSACTGVEDALQAFYRPGQDRTQRCLLIQSLRLSGPITFVEVANPNNPELDLTTMKQVLVKAAELGNTTLSAYAYGLCTVEDQLRQTLELKRYQGLLLHGSALLDVLSNQRVHIQVTRLSMRQGVHNSVLHPCSTV